MINVLNIYEYLNNRQASTIRSIIPLTITALEKLPSSESSKIMLGVSEKRKIDASKTDLWAFYIRVAYVAHYLNTFYF
jgi:hypothetical protein